MVSCLKIASEAGRASLQIAQRKLKSTFNRNFIAAQKPFQTKFLTAFLLLLSLEILRLTPNRKGFASGIESIFTIADRTLFSDCLKLYEMTSACCPLEGIME